MHVEEFDPGILPGSASEHNATCEGGGLRSVGRNSYMRGKTFDYWPRGTLRDLTIGRDNVDVSIRSSTPCDAAIEPALTRWKPV